MASLVNYEGENLPAWRNNQEYYLGLVQAWRNFCKRDIVCQLRIK